MKVWGHIALLCATVGIAGCAGLTQLQDTVAKFDQGAHTANAAQMNFFKQVQVAECNSNFYKAAFAFASAQKGRDGRYPSVPIDVLTQCTPQELTNEQVAIRQKLMDTLTLYADAIQTLANGTSETELSKNSQSLASNIQALANSKRFAVTNTDSAALNTAIVTITRMIIDHTKYKDIKSAASSMQISLKTIVLALEQENRNDVAGLASKADGLQNEFRTALIADRDHRGTASFLSIVEAHNVLPSITVAPPDADQLNNTLDAMLAANEALARAENGGAIPEVSDLISRAQQAATLFKSANK